MLLHVLADCGEVGRAVQAQCPTERPALLGQGHAPQVQVHRGAPARQSRAVVDHQAGSALVLDRDDAQQIGLGGSHPAAHAGAHGALELSRRRAYRAGWPRGGASPRHRPPGRQVTGAGSASLWMSMRHPVSRAASRAFCPSLPIASDSW